VFAASLTPFEACGWYPWHKREDGVVSGRQVKSETPGFPVEIEAILWIANNTRNADLIIQI
jgi:hypothetical protein